MALAENPIMFANNPLDRAGHQRANADWLAAQLAAETALIVPLWNLQPLVLPEIQPGDGRDVAVHGELRATGERDQARGARDATTTTRRGTTTDGGRERVWI